jgi:PhnB protein
VAGGPLTVAEGSRSIGPMTVSPIPANLRAVTPSVVCTPCADAIDFYTRVFGATEIEPRMTGPDGLVAHAEIEIAGSVVMLGDEWPDGPTLSPTSLGGSTMALFVYSEDAPEIWERAVAAGAEVVFPYEKQFYGDEGGRIRDPFGHTWGIGRHVEDVSPEEMERRMAAFYEEQA